MCLCLCACVCIYTRLYMPCVCAFLNGTHTALSFPVIYCGLMPLVPVPHGFPTWTRPTACGRAKGEIGIIEDPGAAALPCLIVSPRFGWTACRREANLAC